MTDVTGFGLAGHLSGICEASGVGATVQLSDVPLMRGGLDLAKAGMQSSLYADNRAGVMGITASDSALAELMFDPQTAGGLLAAVQVNAADAMLAALIDAGYPAAVIGKITDQIGQVTLLD